MTDHAVDRWVERVSDLMVKNARSPVAMVKARQKVRRKIVREVLAAGPDFSCLSESDGRDLGVKLRSGTVAMVRGTPAAPVVVTVYNREDERADRADLRSVRADHGGGFGTFADLKGKS